MSMDHPDLSALSAHHDGEAPEWAVHVAACPDCAARLRQLAALSAAVADVPAAPPPAVDPVAVALAAVATDGRTAEGPPTEESGAGRGSPGIGTSAAATLDRQRRPPGGRPLDEPHGGRAAPSARPGPAGGPRNAADRRRRWLAAAAAAAVLVVAVGVAGVVARTGGGGATFSASRDAPGQSRTAAPAAPAAGPDGATVAGDLGAVPDAAALASRAGAAARAATAADAASAPAAPASSGAVPTPAIVGTRPCEIEARARHHDLGDVVYMATATVAGTPAVILGFAPTVPAGPVTLEAMAQTGCAALLEATLP
ncbi:MAG: hypothetical protein ABR511_10610 [Acidimicrobiales bacterium]